MNLCRIEIKKIALTSLFGICLIFSKAQQIVNLYIEQPGIDNCLATNMNQSANNFSFDLYPNPADNRLIVNINQSSENRDYILSLNNMFGQTLFIRKEKSINGKIKTEVDISNIPAGIYFLRIKGDVFKTSKKIVVTHKQ